MRYRQTRRSFLRTATALAAAAPFVSRIQRLSGTRANFDPSFGTATEAALAIRTGVISSRELLEHVFRRIGKYNPRINAFVTLLEEAAMGSAKQADEALARGDVWGPLHGVPTVIKDTFETAGVRTTAGSKTLEKYVPKKDAVAVARLKKAGAIIIGKTNLPEFAKDLQSFNEVAGTTNNPWDVTRTPGGSTGGGAAALAAGFGFLELGSDIGGSIRTPSHFCGVYGHKPTLNVVPLEGHIPPPPGEVTPLVDLPIAGPMARSAQDLRLELEIIGGPILAEGIAYRWRLPSARGTRLKEYKIGYVLDDPFCPLTTEVAEVLSNAIDAIKKTGIDLIEGWPDGVRPQATFDEYLWLLAAFFAAITKPEELNLARDLAENQKSSFARIWIEGSIAPHKDWLARTAGRLKARAIWQEYFKTHDAFLMPENFVTAFPHDHKLTFLERAVDTPQGKRSYAEMLKWISFSTLTGCPSTVTPVGRTKGGLPVGIQIIGPYLEDATPIHIAGLMSDILGGFEAPSGYL